MFINSTLKLKFKIFNLKLLNNKLDIGNAISNYFHFDSRKYPNYFIFNKFNNLA